MSKLELRSDQMADLAKLIREKKFLNGNKPGTGKTPWTCVNQYRRWIQSEIRTVFVMPKGIIKKNVKEILRFTPFTEQDVAVVDGTAKQIEKILENPDYKILLMGPDRFKLIYEKLKKRFKAIDVDEFHLCFGGASSARTAAFHNFARGCREMNLMSGTFVNGRLDTTWPAIHAVEPRYYPLGYKQFLARHAVLDEYDRPLAWRDHERLTQILEKHGCSRSFESIFGPNAPVIQIELCELSPKQKKLYDQYEKLAMIELENFMISGAQPGVGMMRIQQLLDHPRHFPNLQDIDPETKRPRSTVDLVGGELTGKEEAMLIHVDNHLREGTSFYAFGVRTWQQREMARLINEAGLPCGLMSRDTSQKQRGKLDEDFVSGKLRAIVSSPPIASVGFNWQFTGPQRLEIPQCMFASLPYLDGDFVQAYSRGIRQARKSPLRVTVLWYGTPVEDRVFSILEKKSRDANMVDKDRPILKFDR